MSPTPPPPTTMNPLTQMKTRDRLSGHIGHLSDSQEVALLEFKERLVVDHYYTPEGDDEDASHSDSELLRFLRARKFEVEGAYVQFTNTENWRKNENVAGTYDDFPVEEFKEAQQVYPQWTGRRDKAGLPVYVFKISGLTKDAVSHYSADPTRLEPRMIALYELMVQFNLPFCSSVPHHHQETPISATTTIVDISGVSLARFWALRAHMSRASVLATAYYAETLGTIYIVGAPNFFSVVWGWIGKWFDPGTVEKIFILKDHDVFSTLSQHILPENIPTQFGGDLKWEYGDNKPLLDESAKKIMGLEEVPRGSIRWVKGKLVLKGSGRSEEEIKRYTPTFPATESLSNGHMEDKPDIIASEHPEVTSEAFIESTKQQESESKPTSNGINPSSTADIKSEQVSTHPAPEPVVEEHKFDIWDGAKENPAAPIKELAAAIEGVSI